MNRRIRAAGIAVASALLAACTTISLDDPTCPEDAAVTDLVDDYIAREPAPNPPDSLTARGAECGRDKFTAGLSRQYGKVVGYKAGLTNAAVQKRFNHPSPVRGTLFSAMLLEDGASVPSRFGARPLYEADLVVQVRGPAIHAARTPLEVLRQVTAIYPFIELPDLTLRDTSRIGGPALIYVNVGARLGVLGKPLAVTADPSIVAALENMTVRLLDGDGRELDSAKGSAILGHPLNAAIWLAADLRRSGITLQAGDLLSLGSFSRLFAPAPGTSARVVYEGVPGNPGVSVSFK